MQRKPTQNTRGPNAEEKRFQHWVKERGQCAACKRFFGYGNVILHHCEGSTFRHNKVLVGHMFVIGLCAQCDSVITAGSRKAFRLRFGPQSLLWADLFLEYLNAIGASFNDVNPEPDYVRAILSWGK